VINPIVERKPENNAISELRKGPSFTKGPIKNIHELIQFLNHAIKVLIQIGKQVNF
jgi:hypothetical protein